MIKINTDKCEKCVHNDICKNNGYIEKLVELHKMIEYNAEFCKVYINLMCEYFKEKDSPPITWAPGVKSLGGFLEPSTITPLDTNFAKACNCALPAMTGSTECCKGCMNNPTKINIATNAIEDISLVMVAFQPQQIKT